MGGYFVPKGEIATEFFEKKSRFITHLAGVTSRQEAVAFITQINQKHGSANHNCVAFIIGDPKTPTDIHCSDDGEPSGTAGKPMLNILGHNNIGDVVVVVTRYFGGIKLGTGGLVRAYSNGVKEGVAVAELIRFVEEIELEFSFSYQFEGGVRKLMAEVGGTIVNTQYSESVTFMVSVVATLEAKVIAELNEITAGRVLLG